MGDTANSRGRHFRFGREGPPLRAPGSLAVDLRPVRAGRIAPTCPDFARCRPSTEAQPRRGRTVSSGELTAHPPIEHTNLPSRRAISLGIADNCAANSGDIGGFRAVSRADGCAATSPLRTWRCRRSLPARENYIPPYMVSAMWPVRRRHRVTVRGTSPRASTHTHVRAPCRRPANTYLEVAVLPMCAGARLPIVQGRWHDTNRQATADAPSGGSPCSGISTGPRMTRRARI